MQNPLPQGESGTQGQHSTHRLKSENPHCSSTVTTYGPHRTQVVSAPAAGIPDKASKFHYLDIPYGELARFKQFPLLCILRDRTILQEHKVLNRLMFDA